MGVPYKPFRSVEPIGRIPYADVNADTFGAGVGRAVQGVGQQLEQIDTRFQEAEARDADTELQRRLSKLWYDPDTNTGYSTKRLKSALDDGYKTVEQAAREAVDEIGGTIKGAQGQQAFHNAANARLLNFTEKMGAHAQQQRGLWEIGSSEARVKESIAYATNFYNDDQLFDTTLKMIGDETRTQARFYGEEDGSAMTVERQRAAEGVAWSARLTRMKQDNPQGAWDLFNKNAHRIDTVTRLQLEQQLRGAVEPVWMKNAADAIVRGSSMPNTEVGAVFTDKIQWAESRGRRFGDDGKMLEGPPTKLGTAKGDMQVLDSTNYDPGFGVKPAQNDSAEERARVGRDFGQAMLQRYGNQTLALAAYNWGPGNVDKLIAKGFDPRKGGEAEQLFMAKVPEETRGYIEGINKKFPQSEGKPPTNADIDTHLAGWLEEARRQGKLLFPNDPVAQDTLVSQVQQKVNNIAAANNATERANHDLLVSHVLGIGPAGTQLKPGDRPTSLDALLKLPGALDAWVASDPDQKRGILSMMEQEAKGDIPLTQKGLDKFFALTAMSSSDPTRFMGVNLASPDLVKDVPKEYLVRLMGIRMQIDTRQNRDIAKGENQAAAIRLLTPMLKNAKINPSPKVGSPQAEVYDAFVGRLNDSLDRFTETHKRTPNDKEVREIGAGLLAQGRQGDTTYIFGTPPRMYESDSLKTWQTDEQAPPEFVAALKKKLGHEPSETEIVRNYTDFLIWKGAGLK